MALTSSRARRLFAHTVAPARCFCHFSLGGAQLLTPEGDTEGFLSSQTPLGPVSSMDDILALPSTLEAGSQGTGALLEGQGGGLLLQAHAAL